jgi:GH25 family lysozyme M1 (1,4-beta-N-acetylmuramidase)
MNNPAIQALDICIDVSHWQGPIDWPAVAASGIRIAMIKATEGTSWVDPMFERNHASATSASIFVIPYHFLRPDRADAQVQHFQRVAGIGAGTLFMLDWEGKASETATARDVELIGKELAGVAGRDPICYRGIPGSTPEEPTDTMLEWPSMIARYPRGGVESWLGMSAGPAGNPESWWVTSRAANTLPTFAQYTSQGRVPGISGNVDRSVALFPSVEAALAWCCGDVVVEPPKTSDVIEQILAAPRFQDGVQAYQRSRNLVSDAYIGPITLAAIGEDMRKPQ